MTLTILRVYSLKLETCLYQRFPCFLSVTKEEGTPLPIKGSEHLYKGSENHSFFSLQGLHSALPFSAASSVPMTISYSLKKFYQKTIPSPKLPQLPLCLSTHLIWSSQFLLQKLAFCSSSLGHNMSLIFPLCIWSLSRRIILGLLSVST